MIAALVQKDIKLFFRNKFFALITGLGLAVYIALYLLLPSTADDSVEMGLYLADPADTLIDEQLADVVDINLYATEAELIAALEANDIPAGLAISTEATALIAQGQPSQIEAYFAPGIPSDLREAYGNIFTVLINNLGEGSNGRSLQANETTEVVGPDMIDSSISIRDRLLPLILLFTLGVEVMGLATLIIHEAESGTVRALLTSPLTSSQFFTSKFIMGIGLAFVQVLVLVLITGKLFDAPLIILSTLLLGSLLITGLGFLIAAISKDSMAVLAWGMIIIIIFAIPGIGVIFPALNSGWSSLIPSYYLVTALHQTLNLNAGWADVNADLLSLLGYALLTLGLGTAVLRRRFQ